MCFICVLVKGPCVICGAPGHPCPLCESATALYCTSGHRHRDWERHKNECQRLAPKVEINNNEMKDQATCSKSVGESTAGQKATSSPFGTENQLKLLIDSVHGLHVGASKLIPKHSVVIERQPVVIGPVSILVLFFCEHISLFWAEFDLNNTKFYLEVDYYLETTSSFFLNSYAHRFLYVDALDIIWISFMFVQSQKRVTIS